MKRIIPIIIAAILALIFVALAVGLVGGLRTQFAPKPIEYENSLWSSEDNKFSLWVYEYDSETLQCRAELIYRGEEGTYTYAVCDAPYGAMSVCGDSAADEWLRVKCSSSGFTVKINRTGTLEYSSEYQDGEEIRFGRRYLDPLAEDVND